MNPVVQGIFVMMIVGGIYFELQTPGIGFALVVAILGRCSISRRSTSRVSRKTGS